MNITFVAPALARVTGNIFGLALNENSTRECIDIQTQDIMKSESTFTFAKVLNSIKTLETL